MNSSLTFLQSKHIANLETVLEKSGQCIQKLRERLY